MQVLETVNACRQWVRHQMNQNKRIGLVPTMGNLHAGHLSLIEQVAHHCDTVMVSIFVNPTQFGPGEDFDRYPRTLAYDLEQLQTTCCEAVFHPAASEIYGSEGYAEAIVKVPALDKGFCAESRPHFFTGVATVVTKLFNIVQPHCAIFGEKDFQQLRVIQSLVHSLHMPVQIFSGPIMRESSGLAMSSRNRYLSTEQQQQAAQLYAILRNTLQQLEDGAAIVDAQNNAKHQLTQAGFNVDYCSIADPYSMQLLTEPQQDMIVLAAVKVGEVRLIDNVRTK